MVTVFLRACSSCIASFLSCVRSSWWDRSVLGVADGSVDLVKASSSAALEAVLLVMEVHSEVSAVTEKLSMAG